MQRGTQFLLERTAQDANAIATLLNQIEELEGKWKDLEALKARVRELEEEADGS